MISEMMAQAAQFLQEGKIVAFPTETVWGLGANAYHHEACKRIYSIKGRPSDNPLILHVDSIEAILKIAEVDRAILELLTHWMPGPLTLILKKKDSKVFSCGLKTIGVRIPKLDIAHQLISLAGIPIAAPSANLSGKPSLTKFKDVLEVFSGKVDMVLKGPDASLGLESTVIDLSQNSPIYLRPGIISFEDLLKIFPDLQTLKGDGPPISPGMKYRHYSPEAQVFILSEMSKVEHNSGQIGFDLVQTSQFSFKVKDNVEYAKELYAFFVECDRKCLKRVYCQIPKKGELYQAIIHRLEKAAYR